MDILGVDFSGAVPDNNTWLAQGSLSGQELALHRCRPVGRAQLADILSSLPAGAVAALDFPFSVPLQFARHWMPGVASMTQLWAAAANMDLRQFIGLRDAFVARHGEPKRIIDRSHPESYSCLHQANPNMVPMTFRGMQMLSRLWPAGCDVPPLPPQNKAGPVLLEVMPGAVLRSLGLPFKGYKGGSRNMELREAILAGLPQRSAVSIANLEEFRDMCMGSHDCLDSIVAALAAALWATGPTLFQLPDTGGGVDTGPKFLAAPLATLMVEGWLYAPSRGPSYPT